MDVLILLNGSTIKERNMYIPILSVFFQLGTTMIALANIVLLGNNKIEEEEEKLLTKEFTDKFILEETDFFLDLSNVF